MSCFGNVHIFGGSGYGTEVTSYYVNTRCDCGRFKYADDTDARDKNA